MYSSTRALAAHAAAFQQPVGRQSSIHCFNLIGEAGQPVLWAASGVCSSARSAAWQRNFFRLRGRICRVRRGVWCCVLVSCWKYNAVAASTTGKPGWAQLVRMRAVTRSCCAPSAVPRAVGSIPAAVAGVFGWVLLGADNAGGCSRRMKLPKLIRSRSDSANR